MYSLIRKLTGTTKLNPLPSRYTEMDLAELFSDFFYNKIATIQEDLSHHPVFSLPPTSNMDHPILDHFEELSTGEVGKIVMSLAPKSCELDPLPACLFRQCLDHILDFVTGLINKSLHTSQFVTQWKNSVIRPLLKGLPSVISHQQTKNFRPVSNVPFLSKVLEKVALQQIHSHCDDLILDYQSAYREGYSCETTICKLVTDILWNMEHKKITAMIFLDLSAAFNTVDHRILHQVLQTSFRIEGTSLQWLDSYLAPRWCQAAVNSSYSNKHELPFSVPQGSCMGPMLYTLYASTLCTVIPDNTQIHRYADDHMLKQAFDPGYPGTEEIILLDLSQTMNHVNDWMCQNCLKLNPSKTEFIYFGSRPEVQKCVQSAVIVVSESVQHSPVTKYLRVLLDQYLSFKQQVVKACRITSLNLFCIKFICKNLTDKACYQLVKSLVLSHLDYCNIVYLGLLTKDLTKLQRVQNMAAKTVLQAGPRDNSTDCLRDLHWLPCKSQIIYKVCLLVHKAIYGIAPQYLKDIFVKRSQKGRTHDCLLVVPYTARKTFADCSLSVARPKLWNQTLTKSLCTTTCKEQFKRDLKTHLFAIAFDL